jgi:hypothetical protein
VILRLLLGLSLAANALLAWRLVARPETAAPAAPGQVTERAARAEASVAAAAPAAMPAELEVVEAFHWATLPADLAELRDALRARQCPERVVRAILRGHLRRELEAQVNALLAPLAQGFWSWLDLGDGKKLERLFNELEAAHDAVKQRYEALIAGGPEAAAPASGPPDARTSFLEPDRAAALAALEARLREQREQVPDDDGTPESRVRRREALDHLKAEHDAQVAALLTEEEHAELRLRGSRFADQLRRLEGIELSPDEISRIAALREDFNERRERVEGGESEKDAAREKLRAEEQAALHDVLDVRVPVLAIAENGDWQRTQHLGRRLGIEPHDADMLWHLQDSADERRAGLGGASVAAARLADERQVRRLLGDDEHAWKTYLRHAGDWLKPPKPERGDPLDREW